MKSLELINNIFSLLFPTVGSVWEHMIASLGGGAPDKSPHGDLDMEKYVNKTLRRQLVRTMLVTMREYSHCSIGNNLCVMVLDQIKGLFDVVDVVELQKFVINEFRERH